MHNGAFSLDFINRWNSFYGKKQTKKIQKALQEEDPKVITPNSLITNKEILRNRLENSGFKFQNQTYHENLVLEREPFNVVSTPEYLSGLFTIHEINSES